MTKKKKRVAPSRVFIHVFFIFLALCCLLPMLLVISVSFSNDADLVKYGYSLIPRNFDLTAYKHIFTQPKQLFTSYLVTIFVTVVGTGVGLICTAMLGYGISRKDYPLQRATTFFVFFTMLFSAGIVPWYMLIVNTLQLKDTIWVLILPYLVTPWFVMLMKGFFADIPTSIIEAAKIDGASEFRIFFRVIMPVSKAGLATVGLFIMLMYWNDYYLSLMFIQSSEYISLQYLLHRIMSNLDFLKSALGAQAGMLAGIKVPEQSIRMAMCILVAGPMLFVFPFFQKYFAKGITVGSVKG